MINESKHGSYNFDGDFGDDQPQQSKKKKYHRHNPKQIKELETFFKEDPRPDEKQRFDISNKLGLDIMKVKFWFQNRRTQINTQLKRYENMILRQENEKLQAENNMMKEAMSNLICNYCGDPAFPRQISMEEHYIRIENAQLKKELIRMYNLSDKFLDGDS